MVFYMKLKKCFFLRISFKFYNLNIASAMVLEREEENEKRNFFRNNERRKYAHFMRACTTALAFNAFKSV